MRNRNIDSLRNVFLTFNRLYKITFMVTEQFIATERWPKQNYSIKPVTKLETSLNI